MMKGWFDKYKVAWERRDSASAVALFAPNALYQEDPFEPPIQTEEQLRRYWNDVAHSQRDIAVSYAILSATSRVGIVQWRASFVRVESGQKIELEGIAQFVLDSSGRCTRFLEWWNRK